MTAWREGNAGSRLSSSAELSCVLCGVDDVSDQNGDDNSRVVTSPHQGVVSVTSVYGTICKDSPMRPVRCYTDFSAWRQEEFSQPTT
jgi:hypothetical protein